MEWWTRLIEEPLYPAAAAAVAALLLLWWLLRRARKPKPSSEPAGERPEGLWQIVAGYQESHPSFFYILECFQANHPVDQLCRDREVMEAFQKLDRLRLSVSAPAKGKKSPLRLLTPEEDEAARAPQAPMATILRSIFRQESYVRDFPPKAFEELDRFLDSLTR